MMRARGPLAPPPRFRRIGRDHLNPQLTHGAPELVKLPFARFPFLLLQACNSSEHLCRTLESQGATSAAFGSF